MTRLGFIKEYRLIFIQLLVAFLITELVLHIGYRYQKGSFLWTKVESNNFNVRDFTETVSDSRFVTFKRNYQNKSYSESNEGWDIITDENGFRKCRQNNVANKNEFLVFIGDSIPFGWAVKSEDSVPCKTLALLSDKGGKIGVINAAIPSYSLDQAVQRYRVEIADKFSVSVIVLQVYDPASILAILGRKWNTSANWTTIGPKWQLSVSEKWLYKYSTVYHILKKYVFSDFSKETLDIRDARARKQFVDSLERSLDELKLASMNVKRILLLTPTIPKSSWSTLSPQRRYAVLLMNETLKDYSLRNRKFVFIDAMREFWNQRDEGGLFIDECCHLSEDGARYEVELISQYL